MNSDLMMVAFIAFFLLILFVGLLVIFGYMMAEYGQGKHYNFFGKGVPNET